MRILHVVPPCQGGIRRHVLTLVERLSAEGHRCLVASLSAARAEAEGGGVLAAWPSGASVALGGAARPATAWRLRRLVRDFRPDVVHCHGFRAALAARLALALPGARPGPAPGLVYTLHGPSLPGNPRGRALLSLVERRLADAVGACIAVSEAMARVAVGQWHVPAERVHVIPHGVDASRFRDLPEAARARRALGLAPERPVVGTLARLAPEKGPDLFLRVARLVRNLVPDCQFLIAGEGPARDRVAAGAASLGLADTLRLPGHVADPRLALAALDVFLLTSRAEGLGLALLEAMAAGRPVVATAVGGVAEVVHHRRTGLLLPPGDACGLARAAVTLLEDRELAARLATAARQRVARRHDPEAMARRTQHVYRLAVLRARAGRARAGRARRAS